MLLRKHKTTGNLALIALNCQLTFLNTSFNIFFVVFLDLFKVSKVKQRIKLRFTLQVSHVIWSSLKTLFLTYVTTRETMTWDCHLNFTSIFTAKWFWNFYELFNRPRNHRFVFMAFGYIIRQSHTEVKDYIEFLDKLHI